MTSRISKVFEKFKENIKKKITKEYTTFPGLIIKAVCLVHLFLCAVIYFLKEGSS
jgi:hypothetical protein